jgi:hypothetical protein
LGGLGVVDVEDGNLVLIQHLEIEGERTEVAVEIVAERGGMGEAQGDVVLPVKTGVSETAPKVVKSLPV